MARADEEPAGTRALKQRPRVVRGERSKLLCSARRKVVDADQDGGDPVALDCAQVVASHLARPDECDAERPIGHTPLVTRPGCAGIDQLVTGQGIYGWGDQDVESPPAAVVATRSREAPRRGLHSTSAGGVVRSEESCTRTAALRAHPTGA